MKIKRLWSLCGCFLLCACGPLQEEATSVIPFTSKWPDQVATHIEEVIGYDLPFIEADAYEAEVLTDDYGDPLLAIYCHYASDALSTQAMNTYADLCDQAGYEVVFETVRYFDPSTFIQYEYDMYFADLVISPSKAIELQFLLGGTGSVSQLGIFAFTYVPVSPDEWPDALITSLLGYSIPSYTFAGAEYDASLELDSENNPYVYIQVINAPATSESEYQAILEEAGYTISDDYYDEGYGYIASDQNQTHIIRFMYSVNYGLEIIAYPTNN